MAGDWIKFETATLDKPEVWAIATELGIDPDAVVGKLLRVWAWFDSHSEDGNAPSVTSALLDRNCGVTGFVTAMVNCGWMIQRDGILSLPNFERHNGQTAKSRVLTAKRVAKHKKSNAEGNGKGNAATVTPSVTSALPREEKRREEKKKDNASSAPADSAERVLTTFTCKGGQVWELKETFWKEMKNAYPRHDIRGECVKMKAWLAANESRRKTPQGMKRFIQGWLSKAEPSTPQQPADTRPRMPTIEEIGNARRAREAAAAKRQAEVRSA